MDVQNICKTMHLSPHKICAVKVDGIFIDSEGIDHILSLFVNVHVVYHCLWRIAVSD